MENHYKILGIESSATPEEVKKAYFEMAKKYHPDSGDESEVKKFHEVAEAYRVLSDPVTRKAYDISLGLLDSQKKGGDSASVTESVPRGKRETYRDDELKEFHKNRYKKAVLRVMMFSVMLGLIGAIMAIILDGYYWLGGLSGIAMGFSFSITQNFKVKSFFKSVKAHKAFRLFTWLLFLGGMGYFVWLIVQDLF